MNCALCHTAITWQHGWPACRCDADPRLMLTVAQAAKFMYTSRGCIYHLIDDGYLPADKSTRPIRIAMITLKACLAGDHAYFTYTRHNRQAQQQCGGQP